MTDPKVTSEMIEAGVKAILAHVHVGAAHARVTARATFLAMKAKEPKPDPMSECEHQWVNPSNEVVIAGNYRLCVKCQTLAIPTQLQEAMDEQA